jgi:16S rRNA (cytidine1402-2'-O)-methyltransferase
MPGTLFVVATPIGNLEDLTFRALRTLKEVDLIAAEDTRRTAKLLAAYEIRKPLASLREHNEARETPRLIARLAAGESIALVTDAGTPGIADPGARLVGATRAAGLPVIPIPGPSAVAAALSISGFESDSFLFLGFPPSSGSTRDAWLDRASSEPGTVVFFEAPHRISRTLADIAQIMVERQIVVCRELTKVHESSVSASPEAFRDIKPTERGEFTCVLGPRSLKSQQMDPDIGSVMQYFGRMTELAGFSSGEAVRFVASEFNVPERVASKLVKKGKILAKRQNQ